MTLTRVTTLELI